MICRLNICQKGGTQGIGHTTNMLTAGHKKKEMGNRFLIESPGDVSTSRHVCIPTGLPGYPLSTDPVDCRVWSVEPATLFSHRCVFPCNKGRSSSVARLPTPFKHTQEPLILTKTGRPSHTTDHDHGPRCSDIVRMPPSLNHKVTKVTTGPFESALNHKVTKCEFNPTWHVDADRDGA